MSFDEAIPATRPQLLPRIRMNCTKFGQRNDRCEIVITKPLADHLGVWHRGNLRVQIGILADENVVRLEPGQDGYCVDRVNRERARAVRLTAFHFRDRGYPMPRHEMTECHGIKVGTDEGVPWVKFVLPRWCRRKMEDHNANSNSDL